MTIDDEGTNQSGDVRNFNFHLLKAENELFDEASYIKHVVIRAKRIKTKKEENWQILTDNEICLNLKGTRFTKDEREFLRSVEGMQFLVRAYKEGATSVVKIKEKISKL